MPVAPSRIVEGCGWARTYQLSQIQQPRVKPPLILCVPSSPLWIVSQARETLPLDDAEFTWAQVSQRVFEKK